MVTIIFTFPFPIPPKKASMIYKVLYRRTWWLILWMCMHAWPVQLNVLVVFFVSISCDMVEFETKPFFCVLNYGRGDGNSLTYFSGCLYDEYGIMAWVGIKSDNWFFFTLTAKKSDAWESESVILWTEVQTTFGNG